MKYTLIPALLLGPALAVFNASAVSSTPVVVNGGSIHFSGQVVNAACSVNASSADMTVQMGQVRTVTLGSAGATGSSVPFSIILDNCDTSVSTNVSVAFSGTTVSGSPTILALGGSSNSSASNLGVQILDRTGAAVTFDGATWSAQNVLHDGRNYIPFVARYIGVGSGGAVAGDAAADANFSVQYQ